jgi:hypothetical protein
MSAKNPIRLLGALALAALAMAACSEEKSDLRLSVAVSKARLSFGDVPSGTRLSKSVTFTNDGDYPVFISSYLILDPTGPAKFRAPTVAIGPTEAPPTLAPGKSVEVPVSMEVGGATGVSTARLAIVWDPFGSVKPTPLFVDLEANVVDSLTCSACETPPADRCVSATDLLIHSPTSASSCSEGRCGFRQRVIACPAGCDFLKLACNPLVCRQEPPVLLAATQGTAEDVQGFAAASMRWSFETVWTDGAVSPAVTWANQVMPTGTFFEPASARVQLGKLVPQAMANAIGADSELGNLLVVVAEAEGKSGLHALRYGGGLRSQPASVRVTGEASAEVSQPSVVAGAGRRAEYGVAWLDGRAGAGGIRFTRVSATTGAVLAEPIEITGGAGGKIVSGPSLVWVPETTQQSWVVAWADTRDGEGGEIYLRRLAVSGQPIGEPVRVTDAAGVSAQPHLVVMADALWVTWIDARSGRTAVMARKVSFAGVPTGDEETVYTALTGTVTAVKAGVSGTIHGYAWLYEDPDPKVAGVYGLIKGVPGLLDPTPVRFAAAEGAGGLALLPTYDQFGVMWTAKQAGRQGKDLMFQRLCADLPGDE